MPLKPILQFGKFTAFFVTIIYSNILDWNTTRLVRFGLQAFMASYSIPKVYPNLNPAAAIPVDRGQILRLRSFAGNYRMSRGKEHGQYVPNSRYVFVTMMDGEMLMHPRYRHPALAEGKPVLYAGEASFNNGRLQWWSNGSGNYRPDAGHAAQASLPVEQFYPYEDILKGMHRREQAGQPLARAGERIGGRAAGVQARFAPGGSQILNRGGRTNLRLGSRQA